MEYIAEADIHPAQVNRPLLGEIDKKQEAKGVSNIGDKRPRILKPNASCPVEGAPPGAPTSSSSS